MRPSPLGRKVKRDKVSGTRGGTILQKCVAFSFSLRVRTARRTWGGTKRDVREAQDDEIYDESFIRGP